MNDDPIDFSTLDPSRNAETWDRMVLALAMRGAGRVPPLVLGDLVRCARAVLAVAAALAFLAWLPGLLSQRGERRDSDPILLLAQWAARDEVPPTADLFRVLGGGHGR